MIDVAAVAARVLETVRAALPPGPGWHLDRAVIDRAVELGASRRAASAGLALLAVEPNGVDVKRDRGHLWVRRRA